MDKKALRQDLLARRRALPPEEVRQGNDAIWEQLRIFPELNTARTILTYVSSKDNEVDTFPLIRTALAEGKSVLVPIARRDGTMDWSRLLAPDDLAPSRFGILEPKPETCRITPPTPDAMVIVPGIAFTPTGHRIGYGGGYYDRFLARHQGTTVALAFDMQIIEALETEAHDTPVDYLITESRVFCCRDLRARTV